MARKRVVEPSGVKTWEDANDALRQIAEAQLAVQDIEGEMNKQILGAKKAAEEQSKPHKDRIAKLERELKVYTGAIGLGLTIPSLLLLGFGHSFVAGVGAGLLFGIGYGIFDANNMPILCQFVSSKHRATAYGIMNMTGVFAGAAITEVLGKWTDGGKLGLGFAMLAIIVLIALVVQLTFLRPKTDNME